MRLPSRRGSMSDIIASQIPGVFEHLMAQAAAIKADAEIQRLVREAVERLRTADLGRKPEPTEGPRPPSLDDFAPDDPGLFE